MESDPSGEGRDPEATYQAFDPGIASPRSRQDDETPQATGEDTPSTRRCEQTDGATTPESPLSDDETIPVNTQGHLFGKYRALYKLGGGGMGFVWLVEHVGFEQQRALKIIKSDVASNPVNLDRFRREAKILAKLSGHPNAVLVYDTNVVGKFAYIEMDFLEGETLKSRLDRLGRMSMADIAWFLGELGAVLGEAHAMGIVHRDIKPQNIMIVPDPASPRGERVKVLDFGIAKILRDAASQSASLGLHTEGFIGTYPYSSPEQLGLPLAGQPEAQPIDARSDIYSVGVMLYEMLTGVRPFGGVLTRILYDHAHTPPPPFATTAPGIEIPTGVESVVRRCLEKDPALRFGSVLELIAGFREAAGLPDAPAAGRVSTTELVSRPMPVSSAAVRSSRRWTGLILAGLAASAAVAGAAMLLIPGREKVHESQPAAISTPPAPSAPSKPPAWIAGWLQSRGLEPIPTEGLDPSGWPRAVRRASGDPSGSLALIPGYYLPPDTEAETSAGTTASGLPKMLTGRKTPARFALIEGGTFTMGAFDNRPSFDRDTEQPGHPVTLSPFYMQVTEVSIGEFARFCEDRGLTRLAPEVGAFFNEWDQLVDVMRVQDREKLRDHPATGVSRRMAATFAHWLGGELPTEAQWEFAARSRGKPRLHVWPDDVGIGEPITTLAHVADWDASWSSEVGFKGNRDQTEQGLYHMAGNVREWCRDVWRTYRVGSENDPVALPEEGQTRPRFAIRGGSYATPTETARVTWRGDSPGHAYRMGEDDTDEDLGFRVVLPLLACPSGPPPPAGPTNTAWREAR